MRSLFIKTRPSRLRKFYWLTGLLFLLALLGLNTPQSFKEAFWGSLPITWQDSIYPAEKDKTIIEQVPLAAMVNLAPQSLAAGTQEVLQDSEDPSSQSRIDTEAQIHAFVQNWAASWSAKNLDAYFSAYALQFQPEGGKTRQVWKKEREQKILSKTKISVLISDFVIMSSDSAGTILRFNQIYEANRHASDRFQSTTPKVLVVKHMDDDWKIIREYTP